MTQGHRRNYTTLTDAISPRVYTSSWTGFGALNSICTPQGTHDVPWIAAGKAMHEDP